jgi:hypothetical protein
MLPLSRHPVLLLGLVFSAAVTPGVLSAQTVGSQPVRADVVIRGTIVVGDQVFLDRVVVPAAAIVQRGSIRREVVFVLRDADSLGRGRAEWRYVATGLRNETHVEILSTDELPGLRPGERVLVGGHVYLAHDVPVHVINP